MYMSGLVSFVPAVLLADLGTFLVDVSEQKTADFLQHFYLKMWIEI